VLKPETNSDSDSLKSKGARWVSAKTQINQKGNTYIYIKEDISTKEKIEKEYTKQTIKTIKVLNTDS
jgi:hypothetical protein